MRSRREFLKTLFVGGGSTLFVPSLFSGAVQAAVAQGKSVPGVGGPILVVLQLSGGNDWLNAVVPMGNDHYLRARPKLGLDMKACLQLQGDTGLHPALAGLKALYDGGDVAIVHGVGYPNANRSHFRSMEIWHTASDAERYESYGWLGRYFDRYCGDLGGCVGVAIGSQAPQAFQAATPKGLSFSEPNQLRVRGDSRGRSEPDASMQDEDGEGHADGGTLDAGASIGMLSGGSVRSGMSALDFVESTAREAATGSEQVQAIMKRVPAGSGYGNTRLARDCSLVARLIAGELPTRVYYVAQGGYDTHTNQAQTHERLLREFGDTLRAFVADLRRQGNLSRVQILVFSEFGRRVKENANGGTDHGAAGPVLVLGGGVRGGIVGAYPSLAPEDLERGDVKYRVDFRSVYATVLERHLGVSAAPVLGRAFQLVEGLGKAS